MPGPRGEPGFFVVGRMLARIASADVGLIVRVVFLYGAPTRLGASTVPRKDCIQPAM